MSWSFRKRLAAMRRCRFASARPLCVAGMMAAAPAFAAQVFVQPTATISAETDSNLDLQPASQPGSIETVQGYIADAAVLVGIATPSSSTTIRPRIDYRDYPADSGDDRLEEYLDFNSSFNSPRGKGNVYVGYERRDEFNAELSSALYDEYAPVQPTAPETGRTVIGGTRESVILLPDYSYNITQRTAAGVSAIYQQLNYSPDNSFDAVDFKYYQAKAYLRWDLDQKTDLTAGGFGSKYEATHFDSRATSGGATATLSTSWTPLLSTGVSVTYQHTDIDTAIPKPFADTANPWGAAVSATYKGQINQFRMDAGRVVTPSGGGGIYVDDQIQFEYIRTIRERLTFTGAAIAMRNAGLTQNVSGDNRTYVRTDVDLKWMITPTWFVQGGYQYMWQKYQVDPDSASNNRLYVRFGYQGRDRQW
jgi:hypothetical protein